MSGVTVGSNNKKYYSLKSSSDSDIPLLFDLMPQNGNLLMELTIINDYSTSSSKILEATKYPDKTKDVQGAYGSLMVDPSNDKWFKDKCGLSCLVIVAVSGNLVKED